MAADRQGGSDDGRPQAGRTEEGSALLHELVEALTAVSNYLAAARQMLDAEPRPVQSALRPILDKSLAQSERAGRAAHRLRGLHRR